MKKGIISTLIVLAMASTAAAQSTFVFEVEAGTYSLVVGADGKATLIHVVVLTPGGTPVGPITPADPPTDPPKPPADPTTPLAKEVQSAADAVTHEQRAETAAALSIVYRQGADFLKDGTLKTPEQAIQWAKMGTNIALRQTRGTAKWQPVRDVIGSGLDDLARKGQLQTTEHYADAFGQIADGLSASAGDTSAFNFAALLELLIKLLPIILALFGI